ncbi:hypothetical protein ACS0TY_031638 [Phlomoides rotata]
MSRILTFSRRLVHLKNLHDCHPKTQSFLSSFSTSASESAVATASEPKPPYIPPPIGVASTKHAGRAVFALRKIEAGELIHSAKPIVCHPYPSSVHKVCYFCLRRLPNKDNTSGESVSFCSQICEEESKKFYDVEKKANWSKFNEYCRVQGLKYPLLLKRFVCKAISGFVTSAMFDLHQPEKLTSDKICAMKEEFVLLRNTLEDAGIDHEEMSFLTEEWYINSMARIRINAFRVELPVGSYEDLHSSAAASVQGEAAVGNAMYMLPAFYNHDCDPNVNIVWTENVDTKMVALRDIEEDEEMRICYLDASMGYEARQKFLYEGYGFKCNCSRCTSEE